MEKGLKEFTDEYLNLHQIEKILGQGGQGVVYRTKDPDLALKLVTDSNGSPLSNPDTVRAFSEKLRLLRYLPIPEQLNLSIPLALLSNKAGYVMRLLGDMIPFSSLWLDGKTAQDIKSSDIPQWLSAIPELEAKKILHYSSTGGLRRRLNLLSECSAILSRLHANGLVYCDLSPENAFATKNIHSNNVWLIDADNLRFDTLSKGGVYTPKFGAPEVVQGLMGNSFGSDCYSFAVLAFYLLSLQHPFIGEKADGSDSGDWADDDCDEMLPEDKAYAGFFPWVDDPDDDCNSSNAGIPRQLLLTQNLIELFYRTFSEDGRTEPWSRPVMFQWSEFFARAADETVKCSSCGMSWYYSIKEDKCPYCDFMRPQILLFHANRWVNDELNKELCWSFSHEYCTGSKIRIPSRLFSEYEVDHRNETILELSFESDKLKIIDFSEGEANLYLAVQNIRDGRFERLKSKTNVLLQKKKANLYFFVDSDFPRVVRCSIPKAEK